MSYQVQQCWRTFSHLTSECFFWTLRKWKSVKDWHRRNELALRRCARLKSWNSKLAVRFARKWSSDTELWHWPLCDEPVHGWQKKTKKESWMNFRLKHMTNQAQNDPPTPLSRTKLRTWSRATTNSGSKMARQIGARLHRGCLHAIRKIQKWVSYGLLRMCEVTWTCTDSITPCWLALI